MRNIFLWAAVGLLTWSPFARAQTDDEFRYYDVEVLVFEILDERSRRAEQWPTDINRELPEPLVQLDKPLPADAPRQWKSEWSFRSLPDKALQLGEVGKLLENVDQYRILMHRAWRQPGLEKEMALPVYFEKSYAPAAEQSFAQARSADTGSPQTTSAPGESILKGYIKIILSRYLHADVDLAYTTGLVQQTPSIFGADFLQPEIPAPTIYRLAQTRRMRSGELHYLDHPALGILIQITPVEIEEQRG